MYIILFEDELVEQLYPATLGRPAFGISCGSYRLIDLASRLGEELRAIVRPHLRGVLAADCAELVAPFEPRRHSALFVNARMVAAVSVIERLKTLIDSGRSTIVRRGNSIAAALVGPEHALPSIDCTAGELTAWCEGLQLEPVEMELPLIEYPHELIRWNMQILAENLADRISHGDYREIADGVFAAPGVRLGQYCVTDAAKGPIVLEQDAVVGPLCYLNGPLHIGARSRVIEHAAIKDFVTLGHTCKIGGEVEATIIEPFTNKQHHGFLGHSYVGSWVNLGAGTSNSDLKNTYGTVSMEYRGGKVDTGMQLLGCVIGDYAKTAINTSIFTGKSVGVCSMVYGYVTTNVPSFANYARSFGQMTESPPEVMIAAQARMFKRRNIEQRSCDVQLIHDMYALTRHEGQLPAGPPKL
jgi:UDP-N-acetylglucosamine diphosphorylase / glucose-1-phosphate thymidylyltransferase / UDP-N-acetylgalactosamine diphosphorylase / glucosamine-1-phosphate N-acetyltransferase / galactosamine-1-phosphate N-acetyltransferase